MLKIEIGVLLKLNQFSNGHLLSIKHSQVSCVITCDFVCILIKPPPFALFDKRSDESAVFISLRFQGSIYL